MSNYNTISITPVLSKVFEHMVSVRLGLFMECRDVFPTTQFTYRKGPDTCDALLCASHSLQRALERGPGGYNYLDLLLCTRVLMAEVSVGRVRGRPRLGWSESIEMIWACGKNG